jgi:bile acid-coenzyme A ligase
MEEAASGPSFAERLRRLAAAAPDARCLSVGAATLTRAALDERTNRMARALGRRGLKPGDLLTIAVPNGIGFIETMIACWKLGATPQPASWRLPRHELEAIVALAESPFVIGEASLPTDRPKVGPEELLHESQDASPLPDCVSPSWKAPTSGGSTGRPKLILSGQPSVYTPDGAALWRLAESDTALMPGPLYHNGPFLTSALALLEGAHLVVMAKFDAEEVLRLVAAYRASWLYLVPTMMSRIHRLPEAVRARYDVSSLRTVWHLAAPCPPWLKEAWIEWLGADVVYELYGATEGQAGTIISGREWLEKRGSVGKAVLGEIKVLGPDGQELPPGEIGELYLRPTPGSPAPYRYLGATSKTLPGGWESVGDIGSIDGDGYVFLSDRRSDLILVGGANVYPAEVEAAIEEHPGVQSCAVIGLPDEDLGQRVHAIVQAVEGFALAELQAHLAERLVRYKLPRSIELVAVSLRDDAGKVRRSQLRDERIARS